MSIIVLFLSLVFIPLLVGEVTGWLPWLTSQVVRASTRRLPAAERERYAEEWQAELKAWPGGDLTRLLFAVRIFVSARDTCRALDGEAVQLVTPKLKATFDRTLAFCALLLLSPVMTAIAVAIKVGDGGPVLFSQIRVGVDGSTFKIFRFRTLVSGEQQKALLAVKNEGGGVVFTIRADPRITRVGRWLRRWSLDELPQLFNVLAGEMSLVGPRPALPEEAALYGEKVRRRLAVRPGVTGLWQITGRSDMSWEEAARLDIRYVENWSLMLDLQILWRTWSAVGSGTGG